MSCMDETHILLYVDGELEPAAVNKLETHLESCVSCRDRVNRVRRENQGLRAALEGPAEVPDIAVTLMQQLGESSGAGYVGYKAPEKKTTWKNRRLWATAASLLVAALLLVTVLFQPSEISEVEANGAGAVVLCDAKVEGEQVDSHIYQSGDQPDVKFIWLEKDLNK